MLLSFLGLMTIVVAIYYANHKQATRLETIAKEFNLEESII